VLLDGILPPMISYAGPRQLSRGRAWPRSCGRGSRRFFLLAAGALHVLSSFRKQAIKRRIESLALAVLGPVRSSGAHTSGLVDRYRRLSAPRLGAPESAALARCCKYSARYPVAEVQYLPLWITLKASRTSPFGALEPSRLWRILGALR